MDKALKFDMICNTILILLGIFFHPLYYFLALGSIISTIMIVYNHREGNNTEM